MATPAKGQSAFARKLAADPELAKRCSQIAESLRAAVREEIRSLERAEQLTAKDLAVYINARVTHA